MYKKRLVSNFLFRISDMTKVTKKSGKGIHPHMTHILCVGNQSLIIKHHCFIGDKYDDSKTQSMLFPHVILGRGPHYKLSPVIFVFEALVCRSICMNRVLVDIEDLKGCRAFCISRQVNLSVHNPITQSYVKYPNE